MPFAGFSINIDGAGVASILFTLVTIFAGVVAFIMVWHWRKYGLKSPMIFLMEAIYLTGTALLVSSAFFELGKM